MGGARHILCMVEKRNIYRVLVQKLKEKSNLKDQGIRGKT
jgi:hypothetical protein